MKDNQFFVSVIIPVYNGARFLREAIENVLAQNYSPLELLVVDDGSTDSSAAIAMEFGETLTYVYQTNAGPAAARNRGLRAAQGNVIAFLDVDDLWAPQALRLLVDYLAGHPEVEIVQGLVQRLQAARVDGTSVFAADSAPYPFINLGSSVYRRDVFERVGLFDETMWENEDTDWFVRAWEWNVRKAVLDEVTLYYRLHEHNLTRAQRLIAGGRIMLIKKHLDRKRAAGASRQGDGAPRADIRAFIGTPPLGHGPRIPT